MKIKRRQRIIQGNCIDVMKSFNDESFDLIIADPPYGNLLTEAWDKIDDYVAFCEAWIGECRRILKPAGSIYIWCSLGRKSSSLLDIAAILRRDFIFQDMIVWKKQRGRGARQGWLFTREELLWATKLEKGYCWNRSAQYGTEKYAPEWVKRLKRESNPFKRATNVWTDIEEPTIEMARESGGKGKRKSLHPCQKPLAALRRIIASHTMKNDLILDPFAGSGSTLLAAKQLHR